MGISLDISVLYLGGYTIKSVANYKQLISLDEECISILKPQKNKSAYVRELIKKSQLPKPKPKVVIKV